MLGVQRFLVRALLLSMLGLLSYVGCSDDERTSGNTAPDTQPDSSGDTSYDTSADPDVAEDTQADTPGSQISLRLLYEDRTFDGSGFTGLEDLPIRFARVSLVDEAGITLFEARSDADGLASFSGVDLSAPVTAIITADATFMGHTFDVASHQGTVYTMRAPITPGQNTIKAEVEALGGAFNTLDVMVACAERYAPFVDFVAPRLRVLWERGESWPCTSCYDNNIIRLGGHPSDPDEYDDDIIAHELGHYFVEHYSRDDSPGGSHRNRQVNPRLAYGEGVAYFLPLMFFERDIIVDTFVSGGQPVVRTIDFQRYLQNSEDRPGFVGTSDGTLTGDLREEIIGGILLDAWDDDSGEPADRIALGDRAIMDLLTNYIGAASGSPERPTDEGISGVDLSDLLVGLVCHSGVPAEDVEALASDRRFPWTAPATCP